MYLQRQQFNIYILLVIVNCIRNVLVTAQMDQSYVKFTNVKCECDPSYCKFTKCQVKELSPTQATINFNLTILNPPITESQATIDYYRKDGSKYRSFPFKINLNVCQFLENTSQNFIVKQVYELAKNYTNFNRCPFNENHIYLKDFVPAYHPLFAFFPAGDYIIKGKNIVDGKLVTAITLWMDYKRPRNSFWF